MSASTTRQIGGVLLKPDATPFANSSLTIYRDKRQVTPTAGAAIVDEVLRTVTGPGGEVSMALVPGKYLGQIRLSDADRYFSFTVPDGAGPFLIQDLIDQSPATGEQFVLVQDLVLAARAWATNPEDEEVSEGEYSALHWAAKAEEARAGAELAQSASEGAQLAAEDAADRAEYAATVIENPVSYAPQTLSPAERSQARENIAALSYESQSLDSGQKEQARENINAITFIDGSVTLTVGAGGDFPSINAALITISKMHPSYARNGNAVNIKLLSGFVMSEQVLLRDCDMGHVTIISEDAEVVINRSSLTTEFSAAYPAFGVINGRLPVIGALFSMDSSGVSTARDGILATMCSDVVVLPDCGVKNAGRHGLYVNRSSRAHAQNTIWTGAGGCGIYARWSSYINARFGSGVSKTNVSGANESGVRAEETSIIEANNAMANNCVGSGFAALKSSLINAEGAEANGCESHGFHAGQCSSINASDSSAINVGGHAYFSTENSDINAQGAVGTGAGDNGLYALRSSRINGNAANVSGATSYGCLSAQGSTINAAGANARKGGSDSNADFRVESGGIINLSANSTGGVSTTKNTITNNGIIFQP